MAVTKIGDTYRKESPDASREAETTAWLRAQGLPAPEVLETGPGWLLTRAIPGRTGSGEWEPALQIRVVDALAEVTNALRAVDVERCPFDRCLEVTAAEARQAVLEGRVDEAAFDHERACRSAADLLRELEDAVPGMLGRERLTVAHGDWTLDNVLLDPSSGAVTGFVDTARAGRADRHADLALMQRELEGHGLDSGRYLARCGFDPADTDALAFYRLLDEFF